MVTSPASVVPPPLDYTIEEVWDKGAPVPDESTEDKERRYVPNNKERISQSTE